MALAREVDAREVLVEADGDVGVRLVVAQPDVEARPVLLDEVLLREERLGLRVDDERLDVVDERAQLGAAGEVRRDALADRLRLARRRSRARARHGTDRRQADPATPGAVRPASPCAVSRRPLCNRWYGGGRTATLARTIGSDVYAQEKDDRRGADLVRRRRRLGRPGRRPISRSGWPTRPSGCSRTRGIRSSASTRSGSWSPTTGSRSRATRTRSRPSWSAPPPSGHRRARALHRPAWLLRRTAGTRSARSASAPSVKTYKKNVKRFLARVPGDDARSASGTRRNHVSQPTANKPGLAAKYFLAARSACKSCKIVAADVLDSSNMESWLSGFDRKDKGKARIYGLHNYSDVNRKRQSGTTPPAAQGRRRGVAHGDRRHPEVPAAVPALREAPERPRRSTCSSSRTATTRAARACARGSRGSTTTSGRARAKSARFDAGLVGPTRQAAQGLQGVQEARGEARLARSCACASAAARRARGGRARLPGSVSGHRPGHAPSSPGRRRRARDGDLEPGQAALPRARGDEARPGAVLPRGRRSR